MTAQKKKIEVPQGIIIHSLKVDFDSAPRGIIREAEVEYSHRPPYGLHTRAVTFFSPRTPFPTVEMLLLESIEEIKKGLEC